MKLSYESQAMHRETIRGVLWQLLADHESASPDQRAALVEAAAGELAKLEPPRWLDEKEVAARYPFSVRWLRSSRWEGVGPAFHRIGGRHALRSRVYYHSDDIEAFLAHCRVAGKGKIKQ